MEILTKNLEIIDFGNVLINTNTVNILKVHNNSSIDQTFTIERFIEVPRLDSGFTVIPNKSDIVRPGEIFNFKIELSPKYVTGNCSDLFVVKHLYGIQVVVFTKATVEGPKILLSCTKMQLTCSQEEKNASKKFELINVGNCPAYFQFTVDNNNSCINIKPSQGRILPSKRIQIIVSNKLADSKPLFKRVFCLIEHHEPISFDICVFWSKTHNWGNMVSYRKPLPNYSNGYTNFLHDTLKNAILTGEPLILIDKYNFDFGSCLPKNQKHAHFSLTNNSSMNVDITWINSGDRKTFDVQPRRVNVDEGNTVTFEIIFKPPVRDKIYDASIEANIFSPDHKLIPFPVIVHVKGHSFDELDCGWAAQYRVDPCSVVFPPIVPQTSGVLCPSHATMIIHRGGHLPLGYTFHSPPHSSFTLKPQQGLIHDKLQIVLIQFLPKKSNEALYTENWVLSFNSNERINQCIVKLGGSVEIPQIIINNDKDIVFPKTHPGTPYILHVDVYNPTRIKFKYTFKILKGEEVLEVEAAGEIWPHEHKKVQWTFHPKGIGHLTAMVRCIPSTDSDNETVRDTTVLVKATSEETTLQLIPQKLHFYNVLCMCQQEREFEIINVGDSVIKGDLICLFGDNAYVSTDIKVNLKPSNFYLEPGVSTCISVFVIPTKKGSFEFTIAYKTITNVSFPLIPVSVLSVFPQVEITDIHLSNTGPLFTKCNFWKMLQINKFNRVMYSLGEEGHKQGEVHMQFPSYIVNSPVITVELLLENRSEVGVRLFITQKVVCDCKAELVQVSFSRSKWLDNCPHKNQFKIHPVQANIDPHSHTIFNMNVSFTTLGNVKGLFIVTLAPEDYEDINSVIKLYLNRSSIPNETAYIDTVEIKENDDFVFRFGSVFIGDIHPTIQAFTLYNNTNQAVNYEVDDTNLLHTPFQYIGHRDIIKPTSNHCLLFTFLPYTCANFEADIKLILNEETRKLILKGTGVDSIEIVTDIDEFGAKENKLATINPQPIFLSTNHVYFGPIQATCTQRHIVFFNNKTKDTVSFKWYMGSVADIAELRVIPAKGLVPPGGLVLCQVVCHAGGACHLTVTLTCVYASYTQYSNTSDAHKKYKEDTLTYRDYFVITENGTQNIVPSYPTEEWPLKNYLCVSVDIDVRHTTQGLDEFLPILPVAIQMTSNADTLRRMRDEYMLLLTDILERVLVEAVLSQTMGELDSEQPIYYRQLREIESFEMAGLHQINQSVLEDVLYSIWRDTFEGSCRSSALSGQRRSSRSLKRSEDSMGKGLGTTSISESIASRWIKRII